MEILDFGFWILDYWTSNHISRQARQETFLFFYFRTFASLKDNLSPIRICSRYFDFPGVLCALCARNSPADSDSSRAKHAKLAKG
jgi:hypothetical protein